MTVQDVITVVVLIFELTTEESIVRLQNKDESRLSFVEKLNITVPNVNVALIPGVDNAMVGAVVSTVNVLLDEPHAGFPSISYARQFQT